MKAIARGVEVGKGEQIVLNLEDKANMGSLKKWFTFSWFCFDCLGLLFNLNFHSGKVGLTDEMWNDSTNSAKKLSEVESLRKVKKVYTKKHRSSSASSFKW